MITNTTIFIYHKIKGREEKYIKSKYKAWQYLKQNININKGEIKSNSLIVRIPYEDNNIQNIEVGDLIVIGENSPDILHASDLKDYKIITSITDNKIGETPHIHIGAK